MKRLKPIDVHSLKKGDVFYVKKQRDNSIEKWKVTEIHKNDEGDLDAIIAMCLKVEGRQSLFPRENEEYFFSKSYFDFPNPGKIIAVKQKGKHNLY